MALYEKNKEKTLSDELFANPTKEYRGAPFWAWNTRPDGDMLDHQMKALGEMGFGGFHIHSRTGLDVPYLSDAFMDMAEHCADYARKHDMLFWAYDEDRFPSGFAGGLVTKDRKYRYRELLWTPKEMEALPCRPEGRATESYLIGRYHVTLDGEGCLAEYHLMAPEEPADDCTWYGYLRVAADDSWFNNQSYVDTLDTPSIERFVQVTHERYYQRLGADFGTLIPSFFTDEPKTTYKKTLPTPYARRNIIMPWTDDFPDTYREKYGLDIVAHLPQLFWELPGQEVSRIRYTYHRHVSERFCESYSGTIGKWCDAHGVSLTGHMIKEPSLKSQSTAVGETMAPLAPFGIPGIDMLCDEREYTTAKQAQSVAHQYGREAVLSELYGVTNWDFDFRGHKLGGDWQAALGVTVRVPHLAWMTMEGEAKRDYPASIHYQSPWYREYKLVEDHFARLNTAMTRGRAKVRIGVIHPVESYWCWWGAESQTAGIRRELDDSFQQLTEWLLFEHLDFDFISENIFSSIGRADGPQLRAGESVYDAVLVPGCRTLRSTTVDALEQMLENGGCVVVAGSMPELMEGVKAPELPRRLSGAVHIPFEKSAILRALEPFREVKLVDGSGNTCVKQLHQLRQDGEDQWLFIVYGKKKPRYDCEGLSWMNIRVKGIWYPKQYDTMTGKIFACDYRHENGDTIIIQGYYVHDDILLKLCKKPFAETLPARQTGQVSGTASWVTDLDSVPVTLSEPNVAVLDMARYAVDAADDTEFAPREEVLRIGQKLREAYGYTPQGGRMAQPWTMEKKAPEHEVTLRFTLESELPVRGASLALEQASTARIRLNGQEVPMDITGWYTDERIQTVAMPELAAGVNVIDIILPFGEGSNMENAFLLGDFGVRLKGTRQILTPPVRELSFGSFTEQGLPFYGGNVTYHLQAETPQGDLCVRTSYYRGAVIAVELDGKRAGTIAFSPYAFAASGLEPGAHSIDLTLYGTRINTFGTLHNCNENTTWFGPDAWRGRGDGYSYEYQCRRQGILKRPELSEG